MFPELLAIKTEPGLAAAVRVAAERNRASAAEWVRRAIRKGLAEEGVELPPFRLPPSAGSASSRQRASA